MSDERRDELPSAGLAAGLAIGLAGCVAWGACAWMVPPGVLADWPFGVMWHRVLAAGCAAVLAVALYWLLGSHEHPT